MPPTSPHPGSPHPDEEPSPAGPAPGPAPHLRNDPFAPSAGSTQPGERTSWAQEPPLPEPGANRNPPGLSFWELIREDYDAHRRDWRSPGFRAVAVHRFGNWRMGVRNPFLRAPLSMIYRALYRRGRLRGGIEVPYTAPLGRRVVIDHHSGIVLNGRVRIGNRVRIRQNTTIGVKSIDDLRAPVIGDDVDIGAGAVILGEVHVGDGAVIGANAVVLQDVPAGAVAVGVPARVVAADSRGRAESHIRPA